MKILLIAYDFPPSPSPQSLRWGYLSSELATLGHEVHVFCPDVEGFGYGGLPEIDESIQVHKTFPGIYAWVVNQFRRSQTKTQREFALGPMPETLLGEALLSSEFKPWHAQLRSFIRSNRRMELLANKLNWRVRLLGGLRWFFRNIFFPDERGEWEFFAKRRLRGLLARIVPDVVITSHEPAVSIPLGAMCARIGYPWIADLGDPVLTTYTEPRWRSRAVVTESMLSAGASLIIVTNEHAMRVLAQRNHGMKYKMQVLTQGFTLREEHRTYPIDPSFFSGDYLELLYTGSFYAFRPSATLLHAVVRMPGVRLSIATSGPTLDLIRFAQQHPENIRLLGMVPHSASLALQSRADVLINLANEDPVQVPGKFYEYLGAGRPILHVRNQSDAIDKILENSGIGWSCRPDANEIRRILILLREEKRKSGGITTATHAGHDAVRQHEWGSLAKRLEEWLSRA